MLFDFITTEEFRSVDKAAFEEQERSITEIKVTDSHILPTNTLPATPTDTLEKSILLSIQEADAVEQTIADEILTTEPIPEKLEESIKLIIKEADTTIDEPIVTPLPEPEIEINDKEPEVNVPQAGKPLEFNPTEKHSFAEWLQLSKIAPVQREEAVKEPETESLHANKYDLINKFIAANPKIAPVKKDTPTPVNSNKTANDSPGLMTETLARVYLEQKKYAKAIQAYEILILKYPEKNAFFADRILEVKNLQQNNN